jgi:serine/threonine protein phosphatase PrpC
MSPLLEVAAVTHPGKARPQNEDCIAADARAGLAVLADGMGGHNAGEVASRMAVELVASQLSQQRAQGAPLDAPRAEALIAAQVAAANATLLEAARAEPEYRGMGTTLVVAVWHDHGVSYGHVGDSRLYLLRRGELRRLTRDHSIVQEQLERGAITPEQARYAPNRNVLTRAVGIDPEVEADVCTREVEPDDVFLLCSDGLTDMLTDDEIRDTLVSHPSPASAAANRLVERANESGGLDNISVVLVRVEGQGEDGST